LFSYRLAIEVLFFGAKTWRKWKKHSSLNSQNFLRTSYEHLMNFLLTSYKLLMNFLQTSYKLITNFLQTSYEFLTNYLQTSNELLTIDIFIVCLITKVLKAYCVSLWWLRNLYLKNNHRNVRRNWTVFTKFIFFVTCTWTQ
jgi:hypothetical protein